MTLQDILAVKGTRVHTISPDATLADVVARLVEYHIGSLLVCEPDETGEDRLVGIVTDRDLLFAHAGSARPSDPGTPAGKCPWMSYTVAELMTRNVFTGSPSDSVEQVMGVMTTKRIRHVPVLSQGKIVGIVSIGDIVKAQHDRLAVENQYMKNYIRG